MKVVSLGGSVTAGAGALSPAHAYPARFMDWVNATFPHPGHQLVNRGIGATSSGIFALCAERMMPTVRVQAGLAGSAGLAARLG